MITLFGLELQRNPLKKYLLTIFAVAAFLLGLTYLFAYIPHKNSSIAIEMAIVNAIAPVFSNYRSIAGLTSILSMVCFAVFSATVFNQFVINDFTGKRFYLLLSYPIKKKHHLSCKGNSRNHRVHTGYAFMQCPCVRSFLLYTCYLQKSSKFYS